MSLLTSREFFFPSRWDQDVVDAQVEAQVEARLPTVAAETYAEAEQAFKGEMRRLLERDREERERLRAENSSMNRKLVQMRSILRVAAERMGGEFVALASELNDNDNGIVINDDGHGNLIVTVIPEWVQVGADEEPAATEPAATEPAESWWTTASWRDLPNSLNANRLVRQKSDK